MSRGILRQSPFAIKVGSISQRFPLYCRLLQQVPMFFILPPLLMMAATALPLLIQALHLQALWRCLIQRAQTERQPHKKNVETHSELCPNPIRMAVDQFLNPLLPSQTRSMVVLCPVVRRSIQRSCHTNSLDHIRSSEDYLPPPCLWIRREGHSTNVFGLRNISYSTWSFYT